MTGGAGIHSLALAFPKTTRTNDYWRKRHPEMVTTAHDRTLARVWSAPPEGVRAASPFAAEMAPYLGDPFRGSVERRLLLPEETALSLEVCAVRRALAASGASVNDIGAMLVSSFLPDQIGIGNAPFVARTLGFHGPAWNLESACSGALIGLQSACALVRAGEFRSVLVVVSCTYSRVVPEEDTLAWSVGDGAAAMIVTRSPEGEGLLAVETTNTAEHCGAMFYEVEQSEGAAPRIRMRATKEAATALRATAERAIDCCRGAASAAGVGLDAIDYFAMPAPVAWYPAFCARALGFPLEKTLNTHASYANTGPVLMPTSLYHAARLGKIRPGNLALVHTVGIVSTASAAVVRWGDVRLGPDPP